MWGGGVGENGLGTNNSASVFRSKKGARVRGLANQRGKRFVEGPERVATLIDSNPTIIGGNCFLANPTIK